MRTFLTFLGMAAVTYFTRVTMILALGRELPAVLRRWLVYVPVAVLAALVAPAAFAPDGRLAWGARGWASLVGAWVAWRTRSAIWTILAGLAAFHLLRLLGIG